MSVSTSLPVKAYIGIGSNLENPLAQVSQALAALAALPYCQLLGASSWYGSTPIGGEPEQPDYINGAACLATRLQPIALLDELQAIEQAQGRVRTSRWAPRTLDLDLLLYGNKMLELDRLTVPHPRLAERAFVLLPLSELEPGLLLPNGASLGSLLTGTSTAGVWRLPDDNTRQRPDISPASDRNTSHHDH